MGVFLSKFLELAARVGLPHARGGVSDRQVKTKCACTSSPRAWGCFQRGRQRRVPRAVFPTRVGVFPQALAVSTRIGGLPHARGGVSPDKAADAAQRMSSPRAWGCFYGKRIDGVISSVFPTRVGVFLRDKRRARDCYSLPHARGGVSKSSRPPACCLESSPRAWGCFQGQLRRLRGRSVFPTRVGVFPITSASSKQGRGLPHARGGVSNVLGQAVTKLQSSPRAWGCF